MMNYKRYKKAPVIDYPDRQWPGKTIEKAPIWCSVDLRDGNQSLVEPMVIEEKIEFFRMLVNMGFTEIEAGFPAFSSLEAEFIRTLIEKDLIPDGVKIQVLSQCRPDMIKKTFETIRGCRDVIFHIYNPVSPLQREVVLGMSREEVIKTAVDAVRMVREGETGFDGRLALEYSPESFSCTEPDFALEICEAVKNAWEPGKDRPLIINLPATVEAAGPNVFADQVEWISRHLTDRDKVILSVHAHNDRGCAVAAAQLALLAGAQRVEGTLFGNGERTGNTDLVACACNLLVSGIDPGLGLENMNEIKEVYERCTRMHLDPRRPYAGRLVFTAFSPSHQDAINKGLKAMEEKGSDVWQVPYLPIDPQDIGRKYEPIIRINSQSDRDSAAGILEQYYGFRLPEPMNEELGTEIRKISERQGEVSPSQIMDTFRQMYIGAKYPLHFKKMRIEDGLEDSDTRVCLTYTFKGETRTARGRGNGPIDAAKQAICVAEGLNIRLTMYEQQALTTGSDSQAASYIELMDVDSGRKAFGVGISSNINRSSMRAIFSAVNRLFFRR